MNKETTYLAYCRWYYKKNGAKKIQEIENNIFIEVPNNFESLIDIRDYFREIEKELKDQKLNKKFFEENVDKKGNFEIKRVVILNMTRIREEKQEEKEKPKKGNKLFNLLYAIALHTIIHLSINYLFGI